MTPAAAPPINFLNIGYFFQVLYNATFGLQGGSLGDLSSLASTIWLFVTIIGYLLTLLFIGALVYMSTRLYQAAEEDARRYTTVTEAEAHVQVEHSRWAYIRQLIESTQESDWRNAIIEADIMLDELLTKLGFEGVGVGDKLKTASPAHFHTLDDAWTAHRVRNDIAHQGSTFQLSDQLAYRTIGHYENVFREFNEI